ncbi:ABC transporter ATP-binding protein [Myxococcota bacterium]|nr:ABC transporter ATP-binding protein [Myxococcota bacterium]
MTSAPVPVAQGHPILEVRGLRRWYRAPLGVTGRRERVVRAVDGVSFALRPRETLGLVGESGCGKSTLGRTVLRLERPDAGEIRFDGRDIAGACEADLRPLRRRMQLVFQDPWSSLNPRMRVGAIVREPLDVHRVGSAAERSEAVCRILGAVGLGPEAAGRFPHEFSGGQRQRIGIARALVLGPELLVCDEPVSALDVSVRAQVLNLLRDLQGESGLAMLFVAHDIAAVAHMSDRVAVMYLGRLVEVAPSERLVAAPLHPYSRALIEAVPVPDPARRGRPAPLHGDPPTPVAVVPRGSLERPAGCGFAGRCPEVMDRCRVRTPSLEPPGGGSAADVRVACFLHHDVGEAEGA